MGALDIVIGRVDVAQAKPGRVSNVVLLDHVVLLKGLNLDC